MGIFEVSEIMMHSIEDNGNSNIVCSECITDEDTITEDGIMTEKDFDEEKIYFCDRCGAKIYG